MDITNTEIRLHPKARDFLFENYLTLRRIFSDVLGQLETDYISIALITQASQIFFMSSKPSIEQNLIEKELWQYDGIYQPCFAYQDQAKLWSEVCHLKFSDLIKQYRQENHNLAIGISIPIEYSGYRVILSFGFRRINPLIQNKIPSHCEKLLGFGRYCLREIGGTILFPEDKKNVTTQPKLELIINNLVSYEHTS